MAGVAGSMYAEDGAADEHTEGADRGLFLVIGDTAVARRLCATVTADRGPDGVCHLVAPRDTDLASAIERGVTQAAVLIHDDVAALRYALALAHLAPYLLIAVTIFDRTIAEQLQRLQPSAIVASTASAAIPSLVGPCLGADVVASFRDGRDRVDVVPGEAGQLIERRASVQPPGLPRRILSAVQLDVRHQSQGTRILVMGLLGLGVVLLADWAWLVLISGHETVPALAEAARVLATVGPGPEHPHGFYGVTSALAMLTTIVLTALFTAGLVDRVLEPRLVAMSGARAVPRSNHAIVVGLGQVGLRLCAELRTLGVAVVAVEREHEAPCVDLARQLRIPVVIGDGTSRELLSRLALARSSVVAAVGSDDLDNVAVAVTVSAISPSTRVVLRAGEQEAVSETRSLLPLGVTRDVTAIGAAYLLARLGDTDSQVAAISHDDLVGVRTGGSIFRPMVLAPRDECTHLDELAHVREAKTGIAVP